MHATASPLNRQFPGETRLASFPLFSFFLHCSGGVLIEGEQFLRAKCSWHTTNSVKAWKGTQY